MAQPSGLLVRHEVFGEVFGSHHQCGTNRKLDEIVEVQVRPGDFDDRGLVWHPLSQAQSTHFEQQSQTCTVSYGGKALVK